MRGNILLSAAPANTEVGDSAKIIHGCPNQEEASCQRGQRGSWYNHGLTELWALDADLTVMRLAQHHSPKADN